MHDLKILLDFRKHFWTAFLLLVPGTEAGAGSQPSLTLKGSSAGSGSADRSHWGHWGHQEEAMGRDTPHLHTHTRKERMSSTNIKNKVAYLLRNRWQPWWTETNWEANKLPVLLLNFRQTWHFDLWFKFQTCNYLCTHLKCVFVWLKLLY